MEELLAERRIMVDRVTVYRWVQTFTAEFIDETYVKFAGHWSYLYRAVDQHGQDIDMLVSTRRNAEGGNQSPAAASQAASSSWPSSGRR